MMKIEAQNPEQIAAEEVAFTFESGLYGLEEYKRFVLLIPDKTMPFAYLQASDEPSIRLLLTDPFVFRPDYEFDLPAADAQALQQPNMEEVAVWVTVSAPDSLQEATMNLLAPLVLNHSQGLGRQVVLHDSGFATKAPLFPAKKEEA